MTMSDFTLEERITRLEDAQAIRDLKVRTREPATLGTTWKESPVASYQTVAGSRRLRSTKRSRTISASSLSTPRWHCTTPRTR